MSKREALAPVGRVPDFHSSIVAGGRQEVAIRGKANIVHVMSMFIQMLDLIAGRPRPDAGAVLAARCQPARTFRELGGINLAGVPPPGARYRRQGPRQIM